MSFFFLSLFFFASFVVRGFCRSGCRQNYHLTPPPPSPLLPSLPIIFFCPYPQFSLWYMWQLFEISARLKLVSVPFSSLLLDIGHLQKRFPGEHHESSEMGQSYYVSQSLHRPISYYILVSFGYTDQSSWSGLRQKGTILFPFLWWPPSLWPREQAELCSAVWTLPDNPGLQIRVWNLPDNQRSLSFLADLAFQL